MVLHHVTSMGIGKRRKSQNTKSVERYNLLLQFPTKKRQISMLTRTKTEQISTYFRKTEFNPVYNVYIILYTTESNQRLSRACIVHLVIKKTNWSYVKTMSCSGSHLGITINIKNTKFVKELPMIDAV